MGCRPAVIWLRCRPHVSVVLCCRQKRCHTSSRQGHHAERHFSMVERWNSTRPQECHRVVRASFVMYWCCESVVHILQFGFPSFCWCPKEFWIQLSIGHRSSKLHLRLHKFQDYIEFRLGWCGSCVLKTVYDFKKKKRCASQAVSRFCSVNHAFGQQFVISPHLLHFTVTQCRLYRR